MNRLALALLLLTTASAAPALPQGKLAYLRGFAPWLESRVGALPRELPHSGDVYRLALSPATGDVAYAEATAGRNSPGLPPMRGLLLPRRTRRRNPCPRAGAQRRPNGSRGRRPGTPCGRATRTGSC